MPVTGLATTRGQRYARAKLYDRLSSFYDWMAEASERRPRRRALTALAVAEGERVLEIGVGTGRALPALARAVGASGRVAGLDLSAGMLRVAKRRVESLGLGEVVVLQQGDALALPYRSGRFDAVFTSFTLELFKEEEIPAVLSEVRRVLRRGGRLALVSLGDGNSTTWRPRFYRWFSSRWPGLIDCRPIALLDVLKEAGFELRRVELSDVSGLPVSIAVGGNGTR